MYDWIVLGVVVGQWHARRGRRRQQISLKFQRLGHGDRLGSRRMEKRRHGIHWNVRSYLCGQDLYQTYRKKTTFRRHYGRCSQNFNPTWNGDGERHKWTPTIALRYNEKATLCTTALRVTNEIKKMYSEQSLAGREQTSELLIGGIMVVRWAGDSPPGYSPCVRQPHRK